MLELLATLTPIALVDGLSIVPLCVLPIAVLLGGRRPWIGSLAFVLGIAVPYSAVGVAIAVGLGSVFDAVGEWAARWMSAPTTIELLVQIVIGIVALAGGFRLLGGRRPPGRGESQPPEPEVGPGAAFLFAAGMMMTGMPGALPYFAAIDQILRAGVGLQGEMAALGYYNLVIVLPLLGLMAIRAVFPQRSRTIFDRVAAFMTTWGPRVFAALLLLLGAVLIADGVGFLYGYPLLPVSQP
jgi:hypothetical protein